MTDRPRDPRTLLAHLGSEANTTGHVTGPIVMSSTFSRDADYKLRVGIDYARDQSPAYLQAEAALATLEGGRDAMLFSSGMAAANAVFSALRPGDHAVVSRAMYWALRAQVKRFGADFGIGIDLCETWREGELARAVQPGKTKLVWIETPANPTWEVSDIEACAAVAHGADALLCVDSTVATPIFTRPLELGADIVMHSATKYLNGHSDVVAGALIAKADSELWARAHTHRHAGGAILGPMEAWLLTRGMRTLAVRVERSASNALELARWLEAQPGVTVRYPGLASHPQHAIAARQMKGGFGGMLSIRTGGGAERAIGIAKRLQVFVRATSLGGTESLVEHRKSVEGPQSEAPDDLLRISVGIEDVADLRRDFEQALH
jgi:cystathionine gamma-synthase